MKFRAQKPAEVPDSGQRTRENILREGGLTERGRLVRTGSADVPSASRASRPALAADRGRAPSLILEVNPLVPARVSDVRNGGQDARRADETSANPVRTRRPRSGRPLLAAWAVPKRYTTRSLRWKTPRARLRASFGRVAILLILLLALATLDPPTTVHAYVGPGAGFAFVSSFLTLLAGFLLGLFYLVTSPIRLLLKALVRRGTRRRNGVRRVVILGLDGMDPQVAERYINQGKLPNFAKLARQGGFARLATSCPAVSPVAWSSFMTGVDASHHNIFDFITRDPNTYEPMLSSASVKPCRRTLSIGRWRIPLGRPRIISYRRSRSFWSILGEHDVFSSVIRVPITFPVERFRGVLLAGMCVPDLRGSQGTYSFYTTDSSAREGAGGTVVVERVGNRVEARLLGPENSIRDNAPPLSAPFKMELDEGARTAILTISGQTIRLEERTHSPWVRVDFKAGLGIRVSGICRFYVKSFTPHFQLYVTPVQIDPQRPALPLSHPFTYAIYLSRLLGRFATLGLAEDTSAVNEGVLDDEGFLEQAYLYHEERERMFLDALEKTRDGLCVCVFDVTDRVQHMFFRTVAGEEVPGGEASATGDYEQRGQKVIEELYVKMDGLVGRTLEKLGPGDVMFVMSDHGFAPFRRGVNLNTWLFQNGYLVLNNGASSSGEWLREVDWTRTKAFALGLTGVFVNRKGREAQGIVGADGELSELRRRLCLELTELVDPQTGTKPLTRVVETEKDFPGPYATDGPDLLVCFRRGYRISWEGASGKVTDSVFENNDRAWSGDHCMDPRLVPGVLFTNRKLTAADPDIKDIAPTVLSLFGVPIPAHMKGKRVVGMGD